MNRNDSPLLAGAALAFFLIVAAPAQQPPAADEERSSSADASALTAPEIDPAQFDVLFDQIKPTKAELRWLDIRWIGTLGQGRDTAAAAQKPMFLWAMNGHPLGTC